MFQPSDEQLTADGFARKDPRSNVWQRPRSAEIGHPDRTCSVVRTKWGKVFLIDRTAKRDDESGSKVYQTFGFKLAEPEDWPRLLRQIGWQ